MSMMLLHVPLDEINMMNSVCLGDSTIFMGVAKGRQEQGYQKYVVGEFVKNPQSGSIRTMETWCTNDYLEVANNFGQRITAQAIKMQLDRKAYSISLQVIPADHCTHAHNYAGQVVAIRAAALRPEYRAAEYQLVYAHVDKGGMVTGRRLVSNESVKRPRTDFLGVVAPARIPMWAEPYRKAAVHIHKNLSQHTRLIMGAVGIQRDKNTEASR